MIEQHVIDDIRLKADIVSVVSRYVQLKKNGRNFKGLCPFHKEKTPSFIVSPEKSIYHCFGCGEGGNVFSFIMNMEKVSFVESVKIVGEIVGIEVEDTYTPQQKQQKAEKDILYDINRKANDFYRSKINDARIVEYLTIRKLTADVVQQFELGYAPDGWQSIIDNLKEYSSQQIESAGLAIKKDSGDGYYDRFRDRLMFPIRDVRGKVIGFSGRVLDNDQKTAKYVNSPETSIFNKGNNLYGLDLAKSHIKDVDYVILVEGQMDVIACHAAGLKNAVASLGTAFTVNQARLLSRYTKNVIIAYDNDSAGMIASERTIEILSPLNFNIKILDLVEKDLDDMLAKHGIDAVKKSVDDAKHYLQFKLDQIVKRYNIADIAQRSSAVKESVAQLKGIQDKVLLDHYLEYLSKLLHINKEVLKEEVVGPVNLYNKKRSWRDKNAVNRPLHRFQKAEYVLLKELINQPQQRQVILDELGVDVFDQELQSVAKILQQNKKTIDLLMNDVSIEEETRKKITELSIAKDELLKEMTYQESIEVVKEKQKEVVKQRLRTELIEAEQTGDEEKVKELVMKISEMK